MATTALPVVLIVAENTSAQFGGEAALPLHYFRILRARGVPVWLATHARVRPELRRLFPEAQDRITYVEDTRLHQVLAQLSRRLPARLAFATTGFLLRLVTQLSLRRIASESVRRHGVTVIHQPMPVSPKEPSLLFGLGAPVVIGPMNGGIDYPPAFRRQQGRVGHAFVAFGRLLSHAVNWVMPGKLLAAALLVANRRTHAALPSGASRNVIELVENGVDLAVWAAPDQNTLAAPAPSPASASSEPGPVRYAFLGRLVDWKAVDLLLEAFARAASRAPMALTVMGDGPERAALQRRAASLGILATQQDEAGKVFFAGWLSQTEAAERLRRHDGLVLPSLMECGGAVVLEAMALGMPVIATAWGGPADYLDASCGVLVEPTSPEALVEGFCNGMTMLATDTGRRRALGAAGRRKVMAQFDWEKKTDRMLEIYRSVTAGAHPSGSPTTSA